MYQEKEYDLVVYIGRFQPFHIAHEETIRQASYLAKNVLVLVGSCNSPRTIKNPWTYEEREQMIRTNTHVINLGVEGIRDYMYDDNAWITEVGETVADFAEAVDASKIAIIGHDKDHTSFYLNYFPQWKFIPQKSYPDHGESIDATKIRRLLFEGDVEFIKGVIPTPVYEYLVRGYNALSFIKTPEFTELRNEWEFVKEYKASWAGAPYEPTFVTADPVVIQSGHVLLVQRGGYPGKGQWALPGGFVDPGEKVRNAAVRELREETKLKVPAKVLNGSIDAYEMFDAPNRSTRGRTITHAYRFNLDPTQSLPRVKGGDDAAKAKWFSFAEFEEMESEMFEDHYYLIKAMMNLPASQVRG